MRLCEALDIQRGDVVSFSGGGGKTSALVRLGYELREMGWRVLATTTTRIARKELDLFPHAAKWQWNLLQGTRELEPLLDDYGLVFVYQEIRGEKVSGIPIERVSRLVDEMNADVLLVEADGSRRLPLKAPRTHEPVWPTDTTVAVPVAGLDALGQPFDSNVVYNPDPIIERYGFPEGDPIQPAWVAQIVRDETLGLKDVPANARIVPLLNKIDRPGLSLSRARKIAQMILKEPRVHSVVLGSMLNEQNPVAEVQRRIGAIVLAGGLSARMGSSKMLLPWGDRTVIEAVVQKLVPFHLADVVVVTGYKAGEISAQLKRYPIRTVFNSMYSKGEMLSSLRVGLRALDDNISAALVVMGDQPQISVRIVHRVLTTAAQGPESIVAPYYMGRRGHPILIPQRYWKALLRLRHGAPRDVINQHPIMAVNVDTDSILRDIDTPEQYAFEKKLAGLE